MPSSLDAETVAASGRIIPDAIADHLYDVEADSPSTA